LEALRAVLLKIFCRVILVDWYLVADVSNDPDDEGITIIFSVGNYCQSPPRDIAEVLNLQLSDGAYLNL
jgi:hypothetical protein